MTNRIPSILIPIVTNALVCGIIGLTFGTLTGSLAFWLTGGMAAGAAIGALCEACFRRVRGHARLYRSRMVIVVLLEVVLTVYVVIPIYAADRNVHPTRFTASITPADVGLPYENITLKTQDALTLTAWYIPSSNGAAIIAVHGFNGNRTHVIYHAQALAEHGYGVLALDMRAHGESGGDRFAAAWNSDLDVLAALDYLEHRPDVQPGRIGALGLSAGGHAVIYGAARSTSIRALVVDGVNTGRVEDAINPFLPEIRPFWFMTPMVWLTDRLIELLSGQRAAPPIREQVARIAPRPILFIAAGKADYEIPLARRYAASAGPTSQVWELPEDYHIGGMFAHPQEYTQRMIIFFDVSLPGQ